MKNVKLKKTRNRHKEHIALLLVIVLLVGVFGVWAFQTKQLFSEGAMNGYKQRAQETNGQIEDGVDFSKKLQDTLPLFDNDMSGVIDAVKESIAKERENDATLDTIAKEMIDEINGSLDPESADAAEPAIEGEPAEVPDSADDSLLPISKIVEETNQQTPE